MIVYIVRCRFVDLITSSWMFVVTCVVLRLVEGVGTAIVSTAIFSTFPVLFPKSVATLVVTHHQYYSTSVTCILSCCMYMYRVCLSWVPDLGMLLDHHLEESYTR